MLIRFLEARKWNAAKAHLMIDETIAWRKKNCIIKYIIAIDNILNTPFADEDLEYFRQNFPHNIHKTDLQGHPVLLFDFGKVNVEKLSQRFNNHTLMMMHIQLLEYVKKVLLPRWSNVINQKVNQITILGDLKGVTFKEFTSTNSSSLLKEMITIDQDYYPELMHSLYLVNIPSTWYFLWRFMKPFIDKRTRSKLHIMKGGYMPALKEVIAENDIPSTIGGKCVCYSTPEVITCTTGMFCNILPSLKEMDDYIKRNKEREDELIRTDVVEPATTHYVTEETIPVTTTTSQYVPSDVVYTTNDIQQVNQETVPVVLNNQNYIPPSANIKIVDNTQYDPQYTHIID